MKKKLKKGIFITFEGPERCGKSTHSRLAADFLRKEGYDVVFTREPGGTDVGNRIRDVLLRLKKIRISALTEMLLFEASRAEHVRRVIAPALGKKKIVVCDRFNDATVVYQGYAGLVPLEQIRKVETVSVAGMTPDVTILLDIPATRGLGKIDPHKKDRMESKDLSFHKRVRSGYLELARRNRKRIKVIRTRDTIDRTFEEVRREVISVVQRYTRTG
jgi:dTMP kinase